SSEAGATEAQPASTNAPRVRIASTVFFIVSSGLASLDAERCRSIDRLAADDGQQRHRASDVPDRHAEVIAVQDREVRQLAGLERAAAALVEREPGAPQGVEAQRFVARGRLVGAARGAPTDRAAIEHPLQGDA